MKEKLKQAFTALAAQVQAHPYIASGVIIALVVLAVVL